MHRDLLLRLRQRKVWTPRRRDDAYNPSNGALEHHLEAQIARPLAMKFQRDKALH